MTKIDSKIPEGPVAEKWTNYKAHQKLVNPANKTPFGHHRSRNRTCRCFRCRFSR